MVATSVSSPPSVADQRSEVPSQVKVLAPRTGGRPCQASKRMGQGLFVICLGGSAAGVRVSNQQRWADQPAGKPGRSRRRAALKQTSGTKRPPGPRTPTSFRGAQKSPTVGQRRITNHQQRCAHHQPGDALTAPEQTAAQHRNCMCRVVSINSVSDSHVAIEGDLAHLRSMSRSRYSPIDVAGFTWSHQHQAIASRRPATI